MLAPALTAHTAGEFATLDLRQLIGRDLRVLPVNMQRTSIDAGTVAEVLADVAGANVHPDLELVLADGAEDALELLERGPADRRILLDVSRIRG
jgi:hypothetical protein